MINQCENHNTYEENNSYMEPPPAIGPMSEGLMQIIWRSRWIVLLTTVVALAAAFVYLDMTTPIYTSTSSIYIEQSGPKIISEMENYGVMTKSPWYLYTQAELLTSTPIIADAAKTLQMQQIKTFTRIGNPAGYLRGSLRATVGKKDGIISISFNSPYPAEAAQVVNAVVDSYEKYHSARKRSTSAEILKILQNEKDKRTKELYEKMKVMTDFKKANVSLAFESPEGNIILQRLGSLSASLTQAQLTTIERKSIYEATKEMVNDPARLDEFIEAQRAEGIYISTVSERETLKSKLDELQFSSIDSLRHFTSKHPDAKALESQIAHTKARIAELDAEFVQAQLGVSEQQYLAAKEKEDQIAKYYEDQRRQALDLNEQLAQYTMLESDYEQTKKLCDILNDRIKELNVTEDIGALNITILEVARPASMPSWPQKERVMGIALVLGLMFGGGLAFLRGWVDQRLRSAEEISAILGTPVLGVVPSMSRKQSIVVRGQQVYLDSDSQAAEAYRTIRTSVFFGAPKDEAKTILVTSPAAVDGKTTLVSNLAIAMAKAGQKVLILDGDFRKPMQHKIFEVNHEDKGLSSVLAGTTTLEETIEPTGVEGLDLLTCGPDVSNPSEMLNSETFAKLLELLSNKYDRVIIDSPPVTAVTDAKILAAICDITLLVLRAEKSTRKGCRQAHEGLLSVGARVLGTVVNDVPRKSRYGYYYGSYGYYYGNGRHKKKKASDRKPVALIEGPGSFAGSND